MHGQNRTADGRMEAKTYGWNNAGNYFFWWEDDKIRELNNFVHERGQVKSLLPNYRANGMINTGLYNTRDHIHFQ